jgi:protein phosphatase
MSERDARTSPIRNVLTRGLGADNGDIDVTRPIRLRSGDRVLLCSDGIHGVVPPVVTMGTLEREDDPQCAAERLIQHANDHGAPDNATAVVIRIEQGVA